MTRALLILSRNPLSLLGLILVALVVCAAVFAPWIAPFPTHNGAVVDFLNNNRPPSAQNPMGTDLVGREGGFTALHFAARDGFVDAAKLLLAHGAELDQPTAGEPIPTTSIRRSP